MQLLFGVCRNPPPPCLGRYWTVQRCRHGARRLVSRRARTEQTPPTLAAGEAVLACAAGVALAPQAVQGRAGAHGVHDVGVLRRQQRGGGGVRGPGHRPHDLRHPEHHEEPVWHGAVVGCWWWVAGGGAGVAWVMRCGVVQTLHRCHKKKLWIMFIP